MARSRRTPIVLVLACAWLAAGCGDADAARKAKKAAEKRAQDAELLAMAYPESSGTQPKSIEIVHDGATDRTTMTLRLEGLRAVAASDGRAVGGAATIHLTSSHKGQTRATDNPEGTIDGSVVIRGVAPGTLAFSGDAGKVSADGREMTLRSAGKNAYTSVKGPGGHDETLRFKFATKDLVATATSGSAAFTFGTLRVDLGRAALADLREFAARLNPKATP